MGSKIRSLSDNGTWTLVDTPDVFKRVPILWMGV